MKVSDLFDVAYGSSLSLNHLNLVGEGEGVAFVSRTAQNNGVVAWVKEVPGIRPFAPGLLTVCLRSRNHALSTFVQVAPFYTGYHLFILRPLRAMELKERLWWAMCIERNRYRYNFGRQANRSLPELELPNKVPRWVKQVRIPRVRVAPALDERVELPSVSRWQEVKLGDLFYIHRGRGLVRRDARRGTTPLVTASARNNGISAFIASPPEHDAGRITVCSNGSVGEAFVQPSPFVATADVTILEHRDATPIGASHFICTIIRQEKYRFNYGRKWPASKLERSTVRLPVTKKGMPDVEAMDRYMRSLPLSALLSG